MAGQRRQRHMHGQAQQPQRAYHKQPRARFVPCRGRMPQARGRRTTPSRKRAPVNAHRHRDDSAVHINLMHVNIGPDLRVVQVRDLELYRQQLALTMHSALGFIGCIMLHPNCLADTNHLLNMPLLICHCQAGLQPRAFKCQGYEKMLHHTQCLTDSFRTTVVVWAHADSSKHVYVVLDPCLNGICQEWRVFYFRLD